MPRKQCWTRRVSWLAILLFALSLLLLWAGCGNGDQGQAVEGPDDSSGQEREIHLNTIAQGVSSEYGRFDEIPMPEDAPPECMVITDNEEYQRLLSISSFQEPPGEVDFTNEVIIAALQGPKSTGGYAISIISSSQSGKEIRLKVDVLSPDPGSMTVQVLTSPYHLVTAERADFDPRGELVFIFADQGGTRIDQTSAEI